MERIVEQALADESFRRELFSNPRQTCEPFHLTEREFLELMGQELSQSLHYEQASPGL